MAGGVVPARGAGGGWRVVAVLALVLALLVTALGSPAPVVAATTWIVQSDADGVGPCPGATCTLRQAIATAVAGDTITFDPGVTTVTLTSELPWIRKSLTIRGRGVGGVTIARSSADGTPDFRPLTLLNGTSTPVAVTLEGLTLTNGRLANGAAASGLYTFGVVLQLRDSVIAGNVVD